MQVSLSRCNENALAGGQRRLSLQTQGQLAHAVRFSMHKGVGAEVLGEADGVTVAHGVDVTEVLGAGVVVALAGSVIGARAQEAGAPERSVFSVGPNVVVATLANPTRGFDVPEPSYRFDLTAPVTIAGLRKTTAQGRCVGVP